MTPKQILLKMLRGNLVLYIIEIEIEILNIASLALVKESNMFTTKKK
jgi:hypothetical protein